MQLRTQILLVYLLVLGLGLAISSSIFISGRQVTEITNQLVEEKLPRLDSINDLYIAIIEHERLLYEYYATTDSEQFEPLLRQNGERISYDLEQIAIAFPDTVEIEQIRSDEHMVSEYTMQLDQMFRSAAVDWDKARELLGLVSAAGRRILPRLDLLVDTIKDDAVMTAENTQQQTELSSSLVIGFALLVIVIAAFVGFYVNSYIRETVKRRRLAMFAERSPNPIMSFSWRGKLNYTNPACLDLMTSLGNNSRRPESLLPDDFQRLLLSLQTSKDNYSQWVARLSDNCTLQYSLSLLRDLDTVHLYIEDISERTKAQQDLKFQAYHDVLTEMPNRRFFNECLQELVENNQHKTPFALVLVSLDRFDLVTASVGYQVGDQILKAVSDNLTHFIQNYCTLDLSNKKYRLDSSKFALLVDELPEHDFAENLAAALVEEMRMPVCIDNNEFHLTVSVGVSHFPDHGENGETLIANADAALTRVKRDGGDGLLSYSQDIHAKEQAWIDIERNLRHAIDDQELVLHYQPKISAHAHQISGVEALIRWRRADGSMVSPGEFIPVAEQTGLIVMIGEWVIHEACRQFERWNDEKPLNIAINLSARQFRHPDFIPMVSECLHHYAIDPAMIELEITESLLMNDIQKSIETMHELKALGFKLSIDDFGTGYSSLSYLKDFPIDKLKIDRAFVMNIENNPEDRTLAKTIVDLAHNLNLTVVAEGVENEQQLKIIEELGVEEIQGFYFSKPISAGDIEQNYF